MSKKTIVIFSHGLGVRNIMNLDGDHDFSKQYRRLLIEKVKYIITS